MLTPQASSTPAPSLFSSAFFVDPYPTYRALRESDPVHWDDQLQAWVLTRYADLVAASNDPRFSRAYDDLSRIRRELNEAGRQELLPLYELLSKMMLFSDPPAHTRLRALVVRAFTPRMVTDMRPRIQRVVDELLDVAPQTGQMDVVADLAYPLPITIIMELLGLPVEERAAFKRWSDDVIAFSASAGDPAQAVRSARELTLWVTRLADERRVAPRADLLSALVAAEEQGERLSNEELLANVVLLLMNGHETTTFMIANGLRALLLHPAQLRALRDDPSLIVDATEELLRFDGSVQMRGVGAIESLEIGGLQVQAGEKVWLAFAAGNRDPEQFPDPDTLDIRRGTRRQLDFGHGAHFCIAAALARAQIQIALASMLLRFPRLRLVSDELVWNQIPVFRGPVALPVEF